MAVSTNPVRIVRNSMNDVRWPNPDREAREDAKPCEHYLWQEGR